MTTAPPIPEPAPATAPAVPAAEAQLRAYLDAFNGGDRATLETFAGKNRPPGANIDGEMRLRSATGGFELERIETSTETSCTALVRERDGEQFARFAIEVAAGPAHTITTLRVRAVDAPPAFAPPRTTDADALAALDARLSNEAAADRFSGAVLIARRGEVLFARAYGRANRDARTDNAVTTQFRIGSMNKMFTAVAVMQLVQAGRVTLAEPLRTYLPDYPNEELAAKVTIHHLLTHTGGTGDVFGPDFVARRLELKTLGDYVKLYGARPLEFEPGTDTRYSNYGFLLLGVVMEKVSHRPYHDFVRDRVFEPAGMLFTDSLPEDVSVPGRAAGYTRPAGADWRPNTETLPYRGTSAGGGYSTVEDLNRFAEALQAHALLDAAHTERMIAPRPSPNAQGEYGYGFCTEDLAGHRCFGHDGGAPGMNGSLRICPKEGYVIAVLSNLDPPAAERAGRYVAARLPLDPAAGP